MAMLTPPRLNLRQSSIARDGRWILIQLGAPSRRSDCASDSDSDGAARSDAFDPFPHHSVLFGAQQESVPLSKACASMEGSSVPLKYELNLKR